MHDDRFGLIHCAQRCPYIPAVLVNIKGENEEISAAFYTREQIREMLKTETFSSRSQTVAWFFKNGCLPGRGEAGEA